MAILKTIGVFFLGAISALFVMYFSGVLLSEPPGNTNINDETVPGDNDDIRNAANAHYDSVQNALTLPSQKTSEQNQQLLRNSIATKDELKPEHYQSDHYETGATCQLPCLEDLHFTFLNSDELSPESLQLASDNAQDYAHYLLQNPNALQAVETAMYQMTNTQDREVLLYVLSKLPSEKLTSTATRLSSSVNAEDRLAAVSLFDASFASGGKVSEHFNTLIQNEQDEKVLIRSLQAIDQIQADALNSDTVNKVSELVSQGDTERIRKAALFAKINMVSDDKEVREGVFSMLEESSLDLQLAGLQAIDSILARQKYRPAQGNWQTDNEILQSINDVANNSNASPQLRIEALNLLSRHF
jgi:hypothetical protein